LWTKEPDRFTLDPLHKMPGLNMWAGGGIHGAAWIAEGGGEPGWNGLQAQLDGARWPNLPGRRLRGLARSNDARLATHTMATITSAELLRQGPLSSRRDSQINQDNWNSFHVLYRYR